MLSILRIIVGLLLLEHGLKVLVPVQPNMRLTPCAHNPGASLQLTLPLISSSSFCSPFSSPPPLFPPLPPPLPHFLNASKAYWRWLADAARARFVHSPRRLLIAGNMAVAYFMAHAPKRVSSAAQTERSLHSLRLRIP